MITFFRRIRKQYADNNKPLKYIRYAIGEIVLVVIGILIALQINNWNEERKEKVLEYTYMRSLLNDLSADIANIDKAVPGNQELLTGLDSLLTHLADGPDSEKKGRRVLLYSVKYTYWYLRLEFSDVTISQLKNSGSYQLIKDPEVSKAIIRYSEGIGDCLDQLEEISNYYHAVENTQKGLLNLSLAKKAYELLDADYMNMFLPMAEYESLIQEGSYFLDDDRSQFGRYYNDLLFYRGTLNNLNDFLARQKAMALALIESLEEKYKIHIP